VGLTRFLILRDMRATEVSVHAGFYCAGLPALTAFAGFVHALERKLTDLAAAHGWGTLRLRGFCPVFSAYQLAAGPAKRTPYEHGRAGVAAPLAFAPLADFQLDLVLQVDAGMSPSQLRQLFQEGADALEQLRLSGGGLFWDARLDDFTSFAQALTACERAALTLEDARDVLRQALNDQGPGASAVVALDRLTSRVRQGGDNDEPPLPRYVAVGAGFRALEPLPQLRPGARFGAPHRFVEPLVGLARVRTVASAVKALERRACSGLSKNPQHRATTWSREWPANPNDITAMAKLTHPTMLSCVRAHNVSVFPFWGVPSTQRPLFDLDLAALPPVVVTRETVRGTQSAASTPVTKRATANVQAIDIAVLPPGCGGLLIQGNVLVTAKALSLETVNAPDFSAAHRAFLDAFVEAGGMLQLADRYVMNLLNGAILFRNRIGQGLRCALQAEDLSVELCEQHLALSGALSSEHITDELVRAQARLVSRQWAGALSGERGPLRVTVRAYVEVGEGQEVFPSQEFATSQSQGQGRVLARAARTDGIAQAALHGRKVANALRTIDTWYPGAYRALPVEPYGVDQAAQATLRGKGHDFYSLMLAMPDMTRQLERGEVSADALFTAAVFLRGGVFSKKAE
jgi:CRISPR-associated protein Csy3